MLFSQQILVLRIIDLIPTNTNEKVKIAITPIYTQRKVKETAQRQAI